MRTGEKEQNIVWSTTLSHAIVCEEKKGSERKRERERAQVKHNFNLASDRGREWMKNVRFNGVYVFTCVHDTIERLALHEKWLFLRPLVFICIFLFTLSTARHELDRLICSHVGRCVGSFRQLGPLIRSRRRIPFVLIIALFLSVVSFSFFITQHPRRKDPTVDPVPTRRVTTAIKQASTTIEQVRSREAVHVL